ALHSNSQGFDFQGDFNSYLFDYNKNNWLQSANFGSGQLNPIGGGMHKIDFTEDEREDYKVNNLTYDANGNILNLKRNGVTNESGTNEMDDFTYHYDGANKLQYIADRGDNENPERYNDLKDQSSNGSPNYFYNGIGQLIADVEGKMLYEYNSFGLVTRINTFAESSESSTDEFTLYAQDFENVTNAELIPWSLNSGQASINYSGIYNFDGNMCESIGEQYNSSILLQLNGNRTASRYFDIVPNANHTLNLDLIAFQKSRIGYKINIYDDNNNLLNSTNYNLSLQDIDDPDHPSSDCDDYYDQSVSLTFRPETSRIRFQIEVATSHASLDAPIFLDNFEIKLNVVPKLALYYNDRGQRVRKQVYLSEGDQTDNTYYLRDTSGNPLAIYNSPPEDDSENLEEHAIYGTDRIGVFYRDQRNTDEGVYTYQLTDHLGNIRAVLMKDGDNAVSITSQTDYYPFGMPMPNRNLEGSYRYKFQGQEKDPETGKEAFELRLWDGKIGRFLKPDPYKQFHSPYLGMYNNPILSIDSDGGYAKSFDYSDPPWNFIDPKDVWGGRGAIYIYAANQSTTEDIPNTIRIHAHGSANGFSAYVNGKTRSINSPEAFDKLMTDVKSPDWKEYKENGGCLRIELLSCNAASDHVKVRDSNGKVTNIKPVNKSFAQKLSEAYPDVEVVGASGYTVTSFTEEIGRA
ncbi:MAG: RHS repeat-associated core domain-containing protein, partial [Bacteroidota bacterium]